MMNIFIMILAALFMAAFYLMNGPATKIASHETDNAVVYADLRAIAECTAGAHNATIRGAEFDDICTEQNGIKSKLVCLSSNLAVTKCEIVRGRKPPYSYIVTATNELPDGTYSDMMDILEANYNDAGTFGIFQEGAIVAGDGAGKRTVPKGIISEMELTDGRLVYMTQYEIPDTDTEFAAPAGADVNCPAGMVKTYRFGRWQCAGYNAKTNCPGDTIWDSDLQECVADETRKPLCADRQTAVLVDSVWECINPFPEKSCPDKMIARLDYTTLEWECVPDPNVKVENKKCKRFIGSAVYGAVGATLRVPAASCTDCERMITDPDTCRAVCVPDPARVGDAACYDAPARSCSGRGRAFYFGFPNQSYAAAVTEIAGRTVPFDTAHSQNRKFNCLDCGDGEIDLEKSFPPYIAVCK